MPFLRAFLFYVGLTAFGAGQAHAASGYDVSDLWWNPNEAGWGMQLVQQNSTVFATIFVYDQLGVPYWYVSTMAFGGLTGNGNPIYTGALYETRGSYFAQPFNPAQTTVNQVGSITFSASNTAQAVLTYTVNGVQVIKNVQRQTLVYENFNGVFTGVYEVTESGCANPAYNSTAKFLTILSISQSGSAMNISAQITNGAAVFFCSFNGVYTPTGSIGYYNANYSCSTGEAGTVTFAEMSAQRFAISGRISNGFNNLGCSVSGKFAAVN